MGVSVINALVWGVMIAALEIYVHVPEVRQLGQSTLSTTQVLELAARVTVDFLFGAALGVAVQTALSIKIRRRRRAPVRSEVRWLGDMPADPISVFVSPGNENRRHLHGGEMAATPHTADPWAALVKGST